MECWCRNLPFGRRATRDSREHVPRKEYARSRHQSLFEENVGKTRKDVVYELYVKGSGVVFTHGECISTPHVRHKRRQPLIKCANITSIYVIFPFLRFYVFLRFFIFLSFCGQQGCFPLLLRIPQLWWGNQTYVVLCEQSVLVIFYPFLQNMFFEWKVI